MSLFSPLARFAGLTSLLCATGGIAVPATVAAGLTPPTYRRIELSRDFFAEGGAWGDLNRDGHLDAIAGPYWYAGPDFTARRELYPPPPPINPLEYSDNFFAFTHDFDRDGWLDVLIFGFPGKDASWLRNPGAADGAWTRHLAFMPVEGESPTFGDLFGNGKSVLLCCSEGRFGYATPNLAEPTQPWTFHAISPPGPWHRFTHALGFGDVNGDGRADLLERGGWWEQPPSLDGDPLWKKHPFDFGNGAQMFATDVNDDGRADIITSLDAHGYGLAWFEQLPSNDGQSDFRRHDILSTEAGERRGGVQFSQLHAVALVDVDRDGRLDIVTGKRWWAHGPDKDPDPNGVPVVYAFLARRAADGQVSFAPRLIDDASGVGVQLASTDANADGHPDFLSVNKRGASVLLSSAPPSTPPP